MTLKLGELGLAAINILFTVGRIHLTRHYTEVHINNQKCFVFIVLLGIVEEMESLVNKLTKQG